MSNGVELCFFIVVLMFIVLDFEVGWFRLWGIVWLCWVFDLACFALLLFIWLIYA